MTLHVEGPWTGWSGHTIVELSDGTVWRQDGYYYEHHNAHRPDVHITEEGNMTVAGMRRAVAVRRL